MPVSTPVRPPVAATGAAGTDDADDDASSTIEALVNDGVPTPVRQGSGQRTSTTTSTDGPADGIDSADGLWFNGTADTAYCTLRVQLDKDVPYRDRPAALLAVFKIFLQAGCNADDGFALIGRGAKLPRISTRYACAKE